MSQLSRRSLMATGGLLGLVATLPGKAAATNLSAPGIPPEKLALNEAFWTRITRFYDKPKGVIQLENGNWGVMARPVEDRYERLTERINRESSFYTRQHFADDYRRIITRLAAMLKVQPDELAFTRNATEALLALISGYNKLKPGDHILYADLDYDTTINAMDWLVQRRGVKVVRMNMPEPASHQNILDAYEKQLKTDPKIRLVLLTHLSHRTGLVIPAKELTALARRYGADTIVDAAHSWGQLDITQQDLGADFIGFNLHKWIGVPIGVGLIYINKDRMADVDPYMAGPAAASHGIYTRIHTGTMNYAAIMAVDAALDFHEMLGPKNKEMRIRHLRALWTEALRDHTGIDILTPEDPRLSAGITSFRLKGKTTVAENVAIAHTLLEKHHIFSVMRDGIHAGAAVRITPTLYNTSAEMQALVRALKTMA